mgnify:CR=1 FL=1
MAIVQGDVQIFRTTDNGLVGSGRCAMLVARPDHIAGQPVSGTIVVNWVDGVNPFEEDEEEFRIVFGDGRQLNVVFTKRTQADNGPDIVRFRGRESAPQRAG